MAIVDVLLTIVGFELAIGKLVKDCLLQATIVHNVLVQFTLTREKVTRRGGIYL